MHTIAITNQKGGTCKTTTAVNLAAALGARGKRVLLIDLDPQASTSAWLAVKDGGKGLLEVFTEEQDLSELVASTHVPGVDLIPSSRWLVGVEKTLASEVGAEMMLRNRLDALRPKRWDYLFLDCPPSVGFLSVAALIATKEVLVPVEASSMAMAGVASLITTLDKVRERLNPGLKLYGVLPCRVDMRTRIGHDVVASLEKHFGKAVFKTRIRETVRLREAWSHAQPVTIYAPKSGAAADFLNLADEVLQRDQGGKQA